nr:clostripain-related cysteine peptidase [bacterium]
MTATRPVVMGLTLLVTLLAGCSEEPLTTTAVAEPEATAAPTTTPATPTTPTATTVPPPPTTTATTLATPATPTTTSTTSAAEPESQAGSEWSIPAKRGYSDDPGVLSEYVKPTAVDGVGSIDGTGRKLLAIYMVGSDLEENQLAASLDFGELVAGYTDLANPEDVEIVVAFGGANKDGWRGMKIASGPQIVSDSVDQEFGNETGRDSYLYRADGANMGHESSLKLFLDYLRDGYVNFDQRFLVFWDHGNTYMGFGGDTNFNSDRLSMDEITNAFNGSGAGIFDLIGFDACLMATVEVAKVIEPHARYMIASEDLEPGHGWLWSAVVEAFAEEDSIVEAGKRMVDNFVLDVHYYLDTGKTLSLLDLGEYHNLVDALDPVVSTFSARMFDSQEFAEGLIAAETDVRSYAVSERNDYRASMDLMHFAHLLEDHLSDPGLGGSLDRLMDAIDRFVVHSKHDGSRPDSHGVAIDAPENTHAWYSAYKVSDAWLDFQSVYQDFRLADTEPPVIEAEYWDAEGTLATVRDRYLAAVTTLYGFVQPIESENGMVEDFFMVVAEEEAHATEDEDVYFAPSWSQVWFTVEYDPERDTAWIPAFLSNRLEVDGTEYLLFDAYVDYYRAGKDYSGYEYPYDLARLTLGVHDDGETWTIVGHSVQTYQVLYSGPDDEEGTVQYDRASFRISPGDKVEFFNFGFNLGDSGEDDWFPTADGLVTFVQEPAFWFEFLEFEDESGELIDYYYAIWAEDAAGNGTLGYLVPSEPVEDAPLGDSPIEEMQTFVEPAGFFEVQTPQAWIKEEPDAEQTEVFRASDPDGNGTVIIYAWEFPGLSQAEYADDLEPWLIETGATDLTRETVTTAQGVPAVLFEGLSGQEAFSWLAHVSDGVGVEIVYWFPIDQFESGRALAYNSFDTLLVY